MQGTGASGTTVSAGYFYNVYIHKPGGPNDLFQPLGWGNGQGTDSNGFPFLTLPNGVLGDWLNDAHETFHIFQYNANSPGFASSGNSQWYIEASANWYADLWDDTEFTEIFLSSGSGGWLRPDDSLVTTAWSFNTFKVRNSIAETYTFELRGDPVGSFGDSAHFRGKVVVLNSGGGASFHDLGMANALDGSLTLTVGPADTALCFIVASMPEKFRDDNPVFQVFPYEMQVLTGLVAVEEAFPNGPGLERARYGVLGQPVQEGTKGLQFILYEDGSVRKVWQD